LNLVRIKGYLSSSLIIWSISLFAQVYNNLDVVILGFFRGVTEVGYYAVARRVVGGGAVVMILLANAVLPRLSSAYRSNMAEFNSSIRRFLKVAVILTLLVFVPLIITSRQLVSFIFGNAYIQASLPLSIMIAGLVLVLFNLPFSTGLIAACFEKDVLAQAAICAFLNVGMNLAFMPKYGMTGAAVSFLVTEAAALLLVVAMYRKRMRVLEADMVSETGKTGKGER
jgi:O-antigen/teichoic acid export membrane protein